MDYQVVLSPRAIASLAEITSYIAQDNPERAVSFGNELLDRLIPLAEFPAMGPVVRRNARWRRLVLKPYIITYRIDPHRRQVAILAFRHAGRRPS
jgi:plasmid stabilization system protein ParE